ncbi:Pycsar system effector family protein [Longispora albida]|uniref:Pycsar system effector family protein n=1 Tax=Longispora albida TaxID=203523 RepID=UPI0012FB9024|nr:Pycsar system effector family protein [Longispora albida]
MNLDQRGAVDWAWRVHAAQENWTAKVDAKAATFLSIDLALLTALAAARLTGGLLAALTGFRAVMVNTGTVLCLLGVILAVAAVYPRLGSTIRPPNPAPRRTPGDGEADGVPESPKRLMRGTVYFGHLRRWQPGELAERLTRITPAEQLDELSHQLVQMARYNWIKHRLVQSAMLTAVLGAVLIAAAITL